MKVAMDGKMPGRVPYGYYRKKKIDIVNGKDKVVSEILSNKSPLCACCTNMKTSHSVILSLSKNVIDSI